MDEWVVLLHVATAFWFVAGILGRNITMARARTATDIRLLDELVTLSGRFERTMVIPGSFAVVVLGLLAAWALGQPLAGNDNWWLLTSLILFLVIGALVPIVFLPHGKVFEFALADARAKGEVTPELRGALRDSAVRNARAAELVSLAVIIALMVTKPF
jgi:Predicted integral membrane protein (DUF2269)